MGKLKPVTPGELPREEFLIPMGLSQYRLAKEIGVPAQRIGEIVAGKRAITADTDLLDAAAADNAVVAALAAKGNPALRQREAEGEARGEAAAILKVLEARGAAVSEAQRQEILRCHGRDRLDRWLRRAAQAASADEVLSES